MTELTPVASTLGGVLIGTTAAALFAVSGRIAGISGIVGGIFVAPPRDRAWRWLFVLGLFAGGALAMWVAPQRLGPETSAGPLVSIAAGLLVGVGTRVGRGCTSGHGVCGLARRSPRSLAATATFIATAMLTVFLTHHIG